MSSLQRIFTVGFLYGTSFHKYKQNKLFPSAQCQTPQFKDDRFSTINLSPAVSFHTLSLSQTDQNEHEHEHGHGQDHEFQDSKLTEYNFAPSSASSLSKLSYFDQSNYNNAGSRPLTIIFCWLRAKNRAVQKYTEFYLHEGYDVLTIKTTPYQLLWPSASRSIIESEILPILNTCTQDVKIIHGFSVGGYLFGQLLKYFHTDPEKYALFISTIKAQIWDSVVDVNGVSTGVSKSFPLGRSSETAQKLIESYVKLHTKLFYSFATKYYHESAHYFYNCPLRVPALFLCSKMDDISSIDCIKNVESRWASLGIQCSMKIWSHSPHVEHMRVYPDEYKRTIKWFLNRSMPFSSGLFILPFLDKKNGPQSPTKSIPPPETESTDDVTITPISESTEPELNLLPLNLQEEST